MGNNINEITSSFETLSELLGNINKQLEDISKNLNGINLSDILGIGSFIIDMGALGLTSAQMCLTIEKSMGDVFSGLNMYKEKMREISEELGLDIAKGLAEGLKDGINVVKMSTTVICNDGVLETIKDELQIKSPSKVMKRLGEYISEGLGDGIKDGGKHIKNAMGDTINSIENASKKMSKIKFGLAGLSAVTAIVLPLIDYFGDMMRTNETLGAKMEQIWAKITEAFKPVTDTVINLFCQFTTGSDGSVSALDTLLAAVNSTAVVLAGVIETIVGFFKEYGDEIVTIVKGVWSVISDLVSGAIDVFGGTFDVITGIFTGNGKKIKSGFKNIYEGIKDIFSGLTGFFSNLWGGIKSVFTKMGSTIANGIGNAFKTIINSILSFTENTINKFIRMINDTIGVIKSFTGINIKTLPTLNIPRLASGGLVSPGQLFVAREAGPELVGNFGARTAVMNNNQIVESVSRGVYAAVKEAMGSGGKALKYLLKNIFQPKGFNRVYDS